MKIVHVVEPFASGIAAFVQSIVQNLRDDYHIIIHGEREYVMRSTDIIKYFPEDNVQFIRWRSAQRSISLVKDTAALVELCRLLRNLKAQQMVDAVHLHSSKSGFLGRLACRMMNITNVIYTPNGAPFLLSNINAINILYKLFEKLGSSFGGKVVCSSLSERDAYRKLGIKAMNINNGIAVNVSRHSSNETPAASAKFRIITCARIVQQKNPALFNAIATYFKDFDQFEFVWVGDGEERHLLTSPNITITGWLTQPEVLKLINSSNLYLSTSQYEGLSFSVLEALSLRKTVLLKDCIGNRDIVKKGLNGDMFTNAKEAILKIFQFYNNPAMLRVMGEYSGWLCNEEFNVDATCSLYRSLYQRV
ncbi:glycosyltransferase family 4 protein [Niastella caeni]|uniref:Glycosyltransferase family 4 protein n=1 Tax=Niastella caeni TaxID=2569763 RepID=A0A4S8HZ36_9BACT|nr:glycosyltransferase [Niastella caeni]THU41108.1 glycosyltransferase family 4 protein [Niastella caeni]